MKRSDFLQTAVSGLAFAGLPTFIKDLGKETKLSILHTNDTHARLDPFPKNDARYPDGGGIARRAGLIKNIRASEPNVLLLDAGDVFQGTPYFNMYHGELDLQLMSAMKYDAMTIGNHEFDNGVDGLVNSVKHANFPVVCSNYHITHPELKGMVQHHLIKDVGPVRIGIFGLGIEFKGLVLEELHKGVFYRDPVDEAQRTVNMLRGYKKCDYVICLSHLGFNYSSDRISDVSLAKKVDGIDLIIGGHTHTFLDTPERIVSNGGYETWISQVGFAGLVLGRIDLVFSPAGKKKSQLAAHAEIKSQIDKA